MAKRGWDWRKEFERQHGYAPGMSSAIAAAAVKPGIERAARSGSDGLPSGDSGAPSLAPRMPDDRSPRPAGNLSSPQQGQAPVGGSGIPAGSPAPDQTRAHPAASAAAGVAEDRIGVGPDAGGTHEAKPAAAVAVESATESPPIRGAYRRDDGAWMIPVGAGRFVNERAARSLGLFGGGR